jgi:hypothetical protein
MAKTIPNSLPPGAEQLAVVDDVTGQIEKVSRTTMDRQTANNRVGPGSDKNKCENFVAASGTLHGRSTGPADSPAPVGGPILLPRTNVRYWG